MTDQIGEGKKSNSPGDDWTDERIVPDTKIAISSPGLLIADMNYRFAMNDHQ